MAAEAMTVGRPVIAYENTALSSTINAPTCGTVVPWRDTRALSNAIRWHLDNPDQSQTIGKKARVWAKEKYDYRSFLNNIMKMYHDVAARRTTRSSK
jgi:glycosyltransferase involved in cell wall biosynthesis